MRLSPFFVVAGLLCTACGGKKAPVAAGEGAPTSGALTIDVPADAKGFASKLMKTTVSGFNPTGSSEFTYTNMTFADDGTWTAQGDLSLGGESIACVEDGTWMIDTMSGDNAVMNWTVTKTTCPSRDSGTEQRVNVAIDGSDVKISFR